MISSFFCCLLLVSNGLASHNSGVVISNPVPTKVAVPAKTFERVNRLVTQLDQAMDDWQQMVSSIANFRTESRDLVDELRLKVSATNIPAQTDSFIYLSYIVLHRFMVDIRRGRVRDLQDLVLSEAVRQSIADASPVHDLVELDLFIASVSSFTNRWYLLQNTLSQAREARFQKIRLLRLEFLSLNARYGAGWESLGSSRLFSNVKAIFVRNSQLARSGTASDLLVLDPREAGEENTGLVESSSSGPSKLSASIESLSQLKIPFIDIAQLPRKELVIQFLTLMEQVINHRIWIFGMYMTYSLSTNESTRNIAKELQVRVDVLKRFVSLAVLGPQIVSSIDNLINTHLKLKEYLRSLIELHSDGGLLETIISQNEPKLLQDYDLLDAISGLRIEYTTETNALAVVNEYASQLVRGAKEIQFRERMRNESIKHGRLRHGILMDSLIMWRTKLIEKSQVAIDSSSAAADCATNSDCDQDINLMIAGFVDKILHDVTNGFQNIDIRSFIERVQQYL